VQLQIGWSILIDIWLFGTLVCIPTILLIGFTHDLSLFFLQLITLIYGDNFFIFQPDVPANHEEDKIKILKKQC
jgi:hypothetical protein